MKEFVIRKRIVAQSLSRLRAQKTHTFFAGYLHLQKRSVQLERLEDLQPDFLSFFKKFFFVADHPLGTPYIQPFTEQRASKRNLWLTGNVAGTYAPGALRPSHPFRQAVLMQERVYSLHPDHAERAFKHLLYSTPVQVAELAAFLYRDFGLLCDAPTIDDVIDVFTYEFGYANEPGGRPNASFRTLFSRDSAATWEADWIDGL